MEPMGRAAFIPRFHRTWPVLASTSTPLLASTPRGAPVTTRSPAGAGDGAGLTIVGLASAAGAATVGAAVVADAAGLVVPFANATPCAPEQPAMAPPASSARPVMSDRRADRRMGLRAVGDSGFAAGRGTRAKPRS